MSASVLLRRLVEPIIRESDADEFESVFILNASGAPARRRSLGDIMKTRAKSIDQALNDPPLTLREIIART